MNVADVVKLATRRTPTGSEMLGIIAFFFQQENGGGWKGVLEKLMHLHRHCRFSTVVRFNGN